MSKMIKGYRCSACGSFVSSTLMIGGPPTTCQNCSGAMYLTEMPDSVVGTHPSLSANVRCKCGYSVAFVIGGIDTCPACGEPFG